MLARNGVPHIRRHDEQLVVTFAAIAGLKPQTALDRHVDMKRTRAAFARAAEQTGVKHPLRRDQHQVAGLAAFVVHWWSSSRGSSAAARYNHSANSTPVTGETSRIQVEFRPGSGANTRRDVLLGAGPVFGHHRALEPVTRLQALPIGRDVRPEILGKPDIVGE